MTLTEAYAKHGNTRKLADTTGRLMETILMPLRLSFVAHADKKDA